MCVVSVGRNVVEEKVRFKMCLSHNIGCAELSFITTHFQLINTSFSIKTLVFRKKGVHMKKCCLDTGGPWIQCLIMYA